MTSNQEHLKTLHEIRSLMERSSRFISLSGLSGVVAGLWALAGAAAVFIYLDMAPFGREHLYYIRAETVSKWGLSYLNFFFLDAAIVAIGALISGIYFTTRKARRKGLKIWDATSRRLLINLLIPLVAGGIFCFALLYHGRFGLIAPATLLFYGLSLVNAGKYTLNDVRYLGLTEIALGLMASFYIGFGLEFWAIGFGLLHIIYGALMYYKYERDHSQSE